MASHVHNLNGGLSPPMSCLACEFSVKLQRIFENSKKTTDFFEYYLKIRENNKESRKEEKVLVCYQNGTAVLLR